MWMTDNEEFLRQKLHFFFVRFEYDWAIPSVFNVIL